MSSAFQRLSKDDRLLKRDTSRMKGKVSFKIDNKLYPDDFNLHTIPCILPPWASMGRVIEDGFGFFKRKESNYEDVDKPQVFTEGVVKRYTLENSRGVTVQIINYGATIVSIRTPDLEGVEDDIVLGYDNFEGYTDPTNPYFGATIGRVAGITSGSMITVNEEDIFLTRNLGDHHLNGGAKGFDKALWESYVTRDIVVMTHVSPLNNEGYPGTLAVQISFQLTYNSCLVIQTSAVTSQPTPVSITNHSYFNLAGHSQGSKGLKEHSLLINADKFVVTNRFSRIPTGDLQNVGATYYDLRVPRHLGKALARVPGGGYDNTFCLSKGLAKISCTFAARLVHPESGRFLEILTDHPAIHVYTGNNLPNPDIPAKKIILSFDFDIHAKPSHEIDLIKGQVEQKWPRPESPESQPVEEYTFPTSRQTKIEELIHQPNKTEIEETELPERKIYTEIKGKMGCSYTIHGGICLMPQEFPDALKHNNFPSTIIYPGETYKRISIYRFGTIAKGERKDLSKAAHDVQKQAVNLGIKRRPKRQNV